MAIQFWINKGHKEKKVLYILEMANHGDISGAMSVCDPDEGMHSIFGDYLNKNFFFRPPFK